MTQIAHINVDYYIDLALRRKWWIICSLVLSLITGLVCVKVIPKTFRANTLILVQSQKIPDSYVDSTVTESVQSRLHTISQQVYSRTSLEKIISEFNLMAGEDGAETASMFGFIESLRSKIKVDIRQRDRRSSVQAFEISFEWHDPRVAADVTNAVASQFIEENLKVREAMAMGTTSFLTDEARKIKEELENREKAVEVFKKKHMGALPDQLQANINFLGQFKEQLANVEMSARNEEERAMFLQRQIDLLRSVGSGNNEIGPSSEPASGPERLVYLQGQLEQLRSKYTEKHPDVMALKREMGSLEEDLRTQQDRKNDVDRAAGDQAEGTRPLLLGGLNNDLVRQEEELKMELERANRNTGIYKAEAKKIKKQISSYQGRVERTPEIELELTKLTRDYATIRERYESLLNKKINAQLSEQLERRQKGEQFKVIDSAIIPEKPIRPDVRKVMLIALIAGLGFGFGLAYLRETIDGRFYSIEDLEGFLETRVLVSIPLVKGKM